MRIQHVAGSLFLAAATVSVQAQNATLRVGSPAPKIVVAKWVKGTPVTTLGAGKVHVVEFWATWCGPCKTSIPHLTELAKKYQGKATFTGVSVWQHEGSDAAILTSVNSFVRGMGAQMNYNVAVDGTSNKMANSWMRAAGQNGIPTAFVVDRAGKIAWIGHPMAELDEVVGQVIAGTYDATAAARRQAQAEAEERATQAAMRPVIDAYQRKDWAKVASESEKVMRANPKFVPQLSSVRLDALLRSNPTAGYTYARELATTTFKSNAPVLNQIAWSIVRPDSGLKNPDYATAIFAAEQAGKLSQYKDANILDTLALSLWKSGQKSRALELQTKAVAIADKDPRVDAATRQELRARLAMMKGQ